MSTSPRRWVLVLGVSSGIGAGCARSFAKQGYGILGVHLDRRSAMPAVEALQAELQACQVQVHFFNANAADDAKRQSVLDAITRLLAPGEQVDVLIHSLAFGSLGPLVAQEQVRPIRRRQLEMTFDVMGASLLWWARDLVEAGLMGADPQRGAGGRIFALTSAGTHRVWPSYGPVSVAKATLDAIVRQLAVELAPRRITVNSIMAGVTMTPALTRIPGHEGMVAIAQERNPSGRMTQPEDVGHCILELSRPGTYWMTGNCIRVDGGEDICC